MSDFDAARIERIISELERIRQSAFWLERELEAELSKVTDSRLESARNLLHYIALRRRDNRGLQQDLAALGLTSLGRSEGHVLGSIENVLTILHSLIGRKWEPSDEGMRPVGYAEGRRQLAAQCEALFGVSDGPCRIMVTMPEHAASEYALVRSLLDAGMNCMRINCAHDDVAGWSAMIEHLERARAETGKACRLFMDLGGPKLRTGFIEDGPRVVRWEPKRNALGEILRPAAIWLTPAEAPEPEPLDANTTLKIRAADLARLSEGDRIRFQDIRGRKRTLRIRTRRGVSLIAECGQISYLGGDATLTRFPPKGQAGEAFVVETEITPIPQWFVLHAGDTFRLTRSQAPAKLVGRSVDGTLLEEPRVPCTLPEVFANVRAGERVLIDDGKMGGEIIEATPDELQIRIDYPTTRTRKLKADKGINFPDSDLNLPALTEKDIQDLDFVIKHADMIGLSFVNRAEDIEELQRQIFRRTSRPIGIVLKIETQRGFDALPQLLLAAMRSSPTGVMIARGDLAVECGFERMAEVQEEILWICEAAHVPVIWATQVLETLSKKGLPSRAEITDAAMSERAECVMLNKGPHVIESVRVLSNIIGRMQDHHDKKSSRLRELRVSRMRGR